MRIDLRHSPSFRLACGGLACAAVVALGGWIAERARLGPDDQSALSKVERHVRSEFDRMGSSLRAIALAQAETAGRVLRPSSGDPDLRVLFDRAASLVRARTTEPLSVTVYGAGPAPAPLAWAGRPSELPSDRTTGPAALFVAPGPLGVRLVRIEPVTDAPGLRPGRLGTVAAECLLAEPTTVGRPGSEGITLATPLAPVVLRTRYEGAGEGVHPFAFIIRAPSGEPLVDAFVDRAALQRARRDHRRVVFGLVVGVLAIAVLLLVGPLLDRRDAFRSPRTCVVTTAAAIGLACLGRGLLAVAMPASDVPLFLPDLYSWPLLGVLARHPADFVLTGLTALGLVALVAGPLEGLRQARRARRPVVIDGRRSGRFLAAQVGTGFALALAVAGYERFLAETFRHTTVDILQFSPHPWHTARMAMAFGLVFFHAAFAWAVVLALRLALTGWRFRRGDIRTALLVGIGWGAPVAAIWLPGSTAVLPGLPRSETCLIVAALAAGALCAPRSLAGFRRASHGFRLTVSFFALLSPAAIAYPSLLYFEEAAKQRVVETVYAPEVLNQRESLEIRLRTAQREIDDRQEALDTYVSVPAPPAGTAVGTGSAFFVWRGTALEQHRVSSAIELYNSAGRLVSRFALNLPEETPSQLWHEEDCSWRTFGEISPFGAHERQLLHAGRNICGPDGVLGTIVIHVILDEGTLSFISSQNPYLELLRGRRTTAHEETPGREIEFVSYGWSRTPLYASGTAAWPIDDALFKRLYGSRRPCWTRMAVGGVDYAVYFENDRSGIYALGYPVIAPIGHFLNLAELAVLAALAFIAILASGAVLRLVGGRRVTSGRSLFREVRESFYRKLFLAFVAASVVPVLTLALVTRAYIVDRLRHDVESAAHKTAVLARQMVEDYVIQQPALSDDAMVGLSRVIGQDVNVFTGARLQATSERDLFASGLLPARTPADVYRAIALDRLPTVVTEEQAGGFRYMVAAAPVRVADRETAILTVPLTLRQQEIEREIDDLSRRIVLAAMLFIMVGAAIGYAMAERIADPVSRLTRATRRIARGDLDARIAASSSDELRRLVEAFNLMSEELQRQRGQLERTHRLEAWAEMARQVAHEIKNPLTPIQLSAEHLRRVHADRGKPLDPVLDNCVDSILTQVRLLRQIASEFSSFGASPTARLAPARLVELIDEVVRPYLAGAGERLVFSVDLPDTLPTLLIDRTLVGRALTNVIDNALHAMPSGGTVTISGRQRDASAIELVVEDTGLGMDELALERLFEPYFSTKAVGTGLGLAIARRNVELNGGAIMVTSTRGAGTIVTITLPVPA